MNKQKFMEKQRLYYDKKFLGSMSGRPIRILSEYLFPLESFNKHQIDSTIVFFGNLKSKFTTLLLIISRSLDSLYGYEVIGSNSACKIN